MHFDFSAFLLLATLLTGGIWLIDSLFFSAKRRGMGKKDPTTVDYARSFFPIILVVFLLRSFAVEPFRIPSGSMMPTLLVGDFILVNKFEYGIRMPVFHNKLTEGTPPKRGDVMVFRYPEDPSVDYIKRVVGVPGDKIGYFNKVVYVNGIPQKQEPVGVYSGVKSGAVMTGAAHRTEQLGDVKHDILISARAPVFENAVTVPPGSYFVLGDNRDNSRDSRFWGFVRDEHIVGRAFMIWMYFDGGFDWSRPGTDIH